MKLIPLVMLPGMGCNNLLWNRVLPFLPKSIKPVMPNLLACDSEKKMLDSIGQLPFKKFMLLGFSMGGYLAQRFYAENPGRISNLALICTSGETKQTTPAAIERSLQQLASESYLAQMIKTDTPSSQRTELFEQLKIMLTTVGTPAIKRQMLATSHRQSSLQLFGPQPPVPSLVIGGRDDKLVPKQHIERLAHALKTTPVWLDTGHMAPLEAPEELGTVLNDWYSEHSFDLTACVSSELPESGLL